jgi:hypothetical protein
MSEDRLAKYILTEYFEPWKAQRQCLEEEWYTAYDAFRGKYSSGNLERWKKLEGTEWRSKVFVRLTKIKVVSAVSQIEDVIFQGRNLPFSISPTPVPELAPGILLPPQEAQLRAQLMQRHLEDVLTETNFDRKLMSSILECAIYGMSWLKSPHVQGVSEYGYDLAVPGLEGARNIPPHILDQHGRYSPTTRTRTKPTVTHPSVWDIFFDMEAPDVQSGLGIIHREKMSKGRFYDLLNQPGFNKAKVKKVCAEWGDHTGQTDDNEGPGKQEINERKQGIEVLEFWGRVPVVELRRSEGHSRNFNDITGLREVEVKTVIAGDQVIYKTEPNRIPGPIKRPFHVFKWEEVPHEVGGVGVPENMKDSQMMVNSGVRCFIDNKALSGNVLMAGNPANLAPGEDYTVYPGKFFELSANVQRARDGLEFFAPPDVGRGLLELVNLFERFADEESNLPRILQGETSQNDPKTAFAFSRLIMNANKTLGKVVRNMDEGQIEPVVQGQYHWAMATHPNQRMKGDYRIKATGFKSFNDQLIRGENLQNYFMFMISNQMTGMMLRPMEFAREIALARDIDPEKFLLSTPEFEARSQQYMQMLAGQQVQQQTYELQKIALQKAENPDGETRQDR